ncbi:hypothetical protein CKAH01_16555 [Colletotrichum kahawae]|nr:hypothetical protein CKAH01_16555 [Colletotrichum kahawae]
MAARAQPPLRQTSRRVCGVEGRRSIANTRYSPNRPLSRARRQLCVYAVSGCRWLARDSDVFVPVPRFR